ncbi:MAG: hypothetical protein ACYSVY_12570 [Planctomycetota bacterium]|jgi:hypothetical protein
MKITRGQKVFVLGVLAVNAVLWIVPSDVVELVARDRQTLLGRYSREHFAWIIALVPISAVAICLHLSPTNAVKKKKAFRVATVLLAVLVSLLAVDIYLRLTASYTYVLGDLAYRRPAETSLDGFFEDVPLAIRTYPDAPPGFGRVDWKLSTDSRGFRNPTDYDRYDVVVLGDSFCEGSKISDDDPWPVRFAKTSGVSVSNLGMSGYAPQNYLAALKDFGLGLQPRYVMCMIYEGNDFRSAKRMSEAPSEWKRFFKRSPIVQAIDEFLINKLGPIGAERRIDGLEMLSWLPLAIPDGPDARYYTFPPSFLVHHYTSRSEFEDSKYWKRTKHNLEQMRDICRQADAELMIVYAPTKPRVVLPLVKVSLPADKVHAFAALRAKRELPEPDVYLANLMDYLDVKEGVVQAWCRENSIALVSLTDAMRESVCRGEQVYYTYNAHWTPVGHAVAGDAVHQFWTSRQAQTAGR